MFILKYDHQRIGAVCHRIKKLAADKPFGTGKNYIKNIITIIIII